MSIAILDLTESQGRSIHHLAVQFSELDITTSEQASDFQSRYRQVILIKKQGYCDPKKEPLGHRMLEMKERYAHLAPKNSQRTVAILENFLNQSKSGAPFYLI